MVMFIEFLDSKLVRLFLKNQNAINIVFFPW